MTDRKAKAWQTVGTSSQAITENSMGKAYCYQSNNTSQPCMTSELRLLLNRYSDDLVCYARSTGSKLSGSLVDCCNILLIEDDSAGGGIV